MPKLAVIGANKPLKSFYRQAKKLGCYIVGIAWEEGAVCKKYCDKFYPVSFTDKEEVLRICRYEKIDGITSFSLESALPTVVYVAQNMGLVSNSFECVELTKDKYSQRTAFQTAGLLVPGFQRVKNVSELDLSKLRFPIIVKPIDGVGSQAIMKLDSTDGLESAIAQAVMRSRSNQAIVEEFIEGREFSVEYLTHNGKHYNLQITDKETSGAPHFIEIAHHQPADIDNELRQKIKQGVEIALTALKIENSPSHTELKLTPDGDLFVIEIGARMGGDKITSDLVRLSTGYDMVKGCIDLAIGNFTEPVIQENNFSGVYFYSSLAPLIGEIIKHCDNYPEIIECEYDDSPLTEAKSNADRRGYAIYKSQDHKFEL